MIGLLWASMSMRYHGVRPFEASIRAKKTTALAVQAGLKEEVGHRRDRRYAHSLKPHPLMSGISEGCLHITQKEECPGVEMRALHQMIPNAGLVACLKGL